MKPNQLFILIKLVLSNFQEDLRKVREILIAQIFFLLKNKFRLKKPNTD